jgi:hypothetical protein
MIVVPFEAQHMRQMAEQDATASLSAHIRPDHMDALARSPWSFTGIVDGRVIGCAGVISFWPGRGEAWAALDRSCGRHMVTITKTARRFFEACPLNRIECIVAAGFQEGHRWAQMLGFVLQTPLPMEKYLPTGEAAFMYARVR